MKKNINRKYIQFFFLVIILYIGYEFHNFVLYINSNGILGSLYRPPSVEAFLPISSLMSFYYFLQTGQIHYYHPAGLFIFLGIIFTSFIAGKSFCSWICPFGLLSEYLNKLGNKLKISFNLPKILDSSLRSLKYLLLAFFTFAIFSMSIDGLKGFLDSDYNLLADVKMYYFFAKISTFAMIVLAVLVLLSIVIKNFWCRFLCPYGALLGIIGLLSPVKIKRESTTCINCKLCDKVCPSNIEVSKVNYVISDECSSCYECVTVCPKKDTLFTTAFKRKFDHKKIMYIILASYWLFVLIGIFSNKWTNNIPIEKYIEVNKKADQLTHPRSIKEAKEFKE